MLDKALTSENAIVVCLANLASMLRLCLAANFAAHQVDTSCVIGTLTKCQNQRAALLLEPLKLDSLIEELLDEVGSNAQVQRALFDAAAALALEKRKLSRQATEVNLSNVPLL